MEYKKTTQWLWNRLGTGMLLTMLVLAGCTSPDGFNPLGPQSAGITTEAENADVDLLLKKNSDTEPSTDAVTLSKWIPAGKGGSLNLKTDTGVFKYQLKIPKGALSQDTEIRMTVPDPNRALIILEPHGIQFNTPVRLNMQIMTKKVAILDPTPDQADPLDIYWYNEINQMWEAQDADVEVDVKKNKVKAAVGLHHFSRYSLGGDASFINKMRYQEGWGVVPTTYYFYSY